MESNRIFFYQDRFMVTWVKIHSITEDRIKYIRSVDLRNIQNVPVDKKEDFLDCFIFNSNGTPIKNISDLNKEYTQEKKDRMPFYCTFNSDQEEIDGDFNGDFDLWLKYHKFDYRWIPTKRYIKPGYLNRPCEFEYIDMTIDKFLDNQLLIPYEEVINNYPSLNSNGIVVGVKDGSVKMTKIKRDLEIRKLLSLRII